ncbi:MAG: hypothetical protein ACREFB_00640, partial [Stellaceae bacterium]
MADASTCAVSGLRKTLCLAWPIDLGLTVASHGWVHLVPWNWEPDTGTLSRVERIGGRPGRVAVRQRDPTALAISADGFREADAPEVLRRVARWVSADWDPGPAVAVLAPAFADEAALIARGGGRLLCSSTFYEDFIKTVLTINTTWSSTVRMTAALVAEPGGDAFPEPAALVDYGEERLRGIARIGFRAPVVVSATRRMLDDGVIDAAGHGLTSRLDHTYLTGLKGIGPYAAAHCRMLLQDFSRIPVD